MGGELIQGLRLFAIGSNDWAVALEFSTADIWYPPREFEFRWKQIEELPSPEATQSGGRGAEQYRRHPTKELSTLITGDDARVSKLIQAIGRVILEPASMRALGLPSAIVVFGA